MRTEIGVPPESFHSNSLDRSRSYVGPAADLREFGIQSFPAQVSPMGFDDLIAIDEEVHVVGDVVA